MLLMSLFIVHALKQCVRENETQQYLPRYSANFGGYKLGLTFYPWSKIKKNIKNRKKATKPDCR